jgi:TfoX/Sxy family transcriptional regulator of competence genes
MVKVSIDVEVYNMKDGKLVDFYYDGDLYQKVLKEIKQKFNKKSPKRYINMIDKWLREKHVSSFTEDDFFRDHSNMKAMWHRSRFKSYIAKMISDGSVLQWHDGSYKVVNNKNAKM